MKCNDISLSTYADGTETQTRLDVSNRPTDSAGLDGCDRRAMSELRDSFDIQRLAGRRFGLTSDGEVWIEAEVYGSEPAAMWQILEAHAGAWRAIEGTRKRLPAHRLKLCRACGMPMLVAPTITRCKVCATTTKLTEIRLVWTGS